MISILENLTADQKPKVISRMNALFNRAGVAPVRWTFTELKRYSDYLEENSKGWSLRYFESTIAQFNHLELDLMRAISKADKTERQSIQKRVKLLNQSTKRHVERFLDELQPQPVPEPKPRKKILGIL